MKVLVACEYSGTVRDAFIKIGHDALSCDLLPTDVPGPHYQGDVFDIINNGWDLMIAHPPCTYLCNSGVLHLYKDKDRWKDMIDGAVFFRKLLQANIPKIAIENPVMHRFGYAIIGVDKSQIIQPWMFGDPESKATCLWLKNLPKLQQTNQISLLDSNNAHEIFKALPINEAQRIHHLSPSDDRWKIRSKTYRGIADAMATQWGG